MHRDPETGRFLAHDDVQFDDIEVVTASASFGVEAANLGGDTGFNSSDRHTIQGSDLIDYDTVVDRSERLHLLEVNHSLTGWVNATETADGWLRVYAEISAQPSLEFPTIPLINAGSVPGDNSGDIVGEIGRSDSIDLIGRPMIAEAAAPFSDGSTGTGGGGSAGSDQISSGMFPAEFGRFHPRDELFVNLGMQAWNIDDAGIHADVSIQHVYGVLEDA